MKDLPQLTKNSPILMSKGEVEVITTEVGFFFSLRHFSCLSEVLLPVFNFQIFFMIKKSFMAG